MKKKLKLDRIAVKSFITNKEVDYSTIKGANGAGNVQLSGQPCSAVYSDGCYNNGTRGVACATRAAGNTCGITQVTCAC
ncbi:MAG: pinensin family lanthipeptide [Bacteroidota bacterium]